MNIVNAIQKLAEQDPDFVALKIHESGKTKTISYRQLDNNIRQLSTYLFGKGIIHGTKILVMVPPGEDLITLIFALLQLGAIPIIIDPGMGIKNFFACARKTQPNVFIGCARTQLFYPILKKFIGSLQQGIFLNSHLKNYLHRNGFIAQLPTNNNENDIAAILFTSGSTGHPKGAIYTYHQFNQQIETLQKTFQIEKGEIDLPLLPVFSLFNPLLGMTTIVPKMNPAKPSALDASANIHFIQEFHISNSFGAPRLWSKLVDFCEKENITLPSLKRVFLAGAPVHPNLLKRLQKLIPNGEAYSPYGATEALPLTYISAKEVLSETYKQTLQGAGTCVGKPVYGVQIRIIPISDSALKQMPPSLPNNTIGEIIASAPFISTGYLNDPQATEKAKIYEGTQLWHRMGDLGYLDDTGRLWFCGRKVERVCTPNKTYYTDCCEAIINAHPEVFRSALIEHQGQAAIVIEPQKYPYTPWGKKALVQRVHQWAKQHATTQDIEHFFIYKSFPVDVRHNAKIHRLTLRNYFAKRTPLS